MKARRKTPPLAGLTPPDHLLGPGRTLPSHETEEDRARFDALYDWLDARGLIGHGIRIMPGLIDPIDDLLMAPIHHPDETWEEFTARVLAESASAPKQARTYTP